MTFPGDVVMTTVTGQYVDADGKPAVGMVVFKPNIPSSGEGITVGPSSVERRLDKNGAFSVRIPASVNGGLDPDFTYDVLLLLEGSRYITRTYQIPASDTPVELADLIPSTPVPTASLGFVFPVASERPSNPQPGQAFYNITTGLIEAYNAVESAWYIVGEGGSGSIPNGTITTAKLADGAVTLVKIDSDALDGYVTAGTFNANMISLEAEISEAEIAIATKADADDVQTALAGKLDVSATAPVLVLNASQEVPGGTAAGTVIVRRTT